MIIALLIIWLILAVPGFVIKGLLIMGLIAIALFILTAIVGYVRRRT